MMQQDKPKRGRPRAYDPDTALAQTQDAFWATGYAATSLDDISAATGMNRPSLYGAFGDKRALYLKALERYCTSYAAAMDRALGEGLPIRDALRHGFDAALSIYLSGEEGAHGCFLLATALTEALQDPEIRAAMSDNLRRLEKRFETCLREAKARREIDRSADPAILAKLASAMIYYVAVQARLGASRTALRNTARAAIDRICGTAG